MIYRPKIIKDSAVEAVSVEDLKIHLRISADVTVEDLLLLSYAHAACILFEDLTCRTVHEKTLEWQLARWPSGNYISLPRATPLIAIVHLKYKDEAGSETEWPKANYIVDSETIPGRLVLASGASWPSTSLYPVHPIRVQYRAGIAISSPQTEADDTTLTVIKMIAAGLWENRDADAVGPTPGQTPMTLNYGIKPLIESLVVHQT